MIKKFLLALLLFFSIPVFAQEIMYMGEDAGGVASISPDVEYVGISTNSTGWNTGVSVTRTFGSGSNRCAIIGVAWSYNTSVSVTLGGSSATLAVKTGADRSFKSAFYYYVNPGSGDKTTTVTIDGGGSGEIYLAVYEFNNVDQTTPIRDTTDVWSTSTSSPSLTVSAESGDYTVDMLAVDGTGSTYTLSVGADQTSRGEWETPDAMINGTSTETGSGERTMSWTISASRAASQVGLVVKKSP